MQQKKLLLIIITLAFSIVGKAQFTAGNIVVYRIGEGTASATGLNTSDAFPVFLDEYTPAGILVRSIALPTIDAGSNKTLTASSTDAVGGSGMLNLSVDGQFLVFTGYDAPVGTTGLSSTRSTTNPRVIGLVKYDGTVNTSTALTDFCSRNAPISATSTNGVDIWCAGLGRADGTSAFRYTTVGSATSTQLITSPLTAKFTTIKDGQLYTSPGGTIYSIGTGLPKTSGQVATPLAGSTLNGSILQFSFVDLNPSVPGPDVLYLADDFNGLQKYSLVSGAWVLNGTIGSDADDYRGLALKTSGTVVSIFASRKGSNNASVGGGEIVSLTDASGYNGAFAGTPVVIASNLTDKASFRGIALAPQQAPLCSAPVNVTTYNITPTSASVAWSSSGAVSYEYAVSTSAVPPASGNITTGTSYTATGLTQGQTYYFHVRANCVNFNNSSWSTVSFVPTCTAPLSISVDNNGYNAAVKWNTVVGANGYEYAITTSATPPSTGTATVDTSITASHLVSVTQYYVHVRSNCGAGGYSSWTTKSFKTSCLNPVVNIVTKEEARQFNWNKVNGAAGYEYALTTYRTPPVGGIVIRDTSFQVTQLGSGLSYYFHVRTKCAENGGESVWTTVPFQTTGLDAYPNPVGNTLTIKLYGLPANNGEIILSDVTGRVVKKMVMTNNTMDVNVRELSSGLYLIKYSDGMHKYTVKVLKK